MQFKLNSVFFSKEILRVTRPAFCLRMVLWQLNCWLAPFDSCRRDRGKSTHSELLCKGSRTSPCSFHPDQAVPINKGRYGLDLQPFTHVVIHQADKILLAPSSCCCCRSLPNRTSVRQGRKNMNENDGFAVCQCLSLDLV